MYYLFLIYIGRKSENMRNRQYVLIISIYQCLLPKELLRASNNNVLLATFIGMSIKRVDVLNTY
jgi:hypothetical protein